MTLPKKRKLIASTVIICALTALIIWILWANTALEVNYHTVTSSNLPQAFDGYRIAQVSDLHNAEFGENNEKLLLMIKEADPDIIAITGDMIDSRNTNIETALKFAEEAVKIAPCFYVTGNHEARISEYEYLKKGLIDLNVEVLDNKRFELEISGDNITLIGVNDPSFKTAYITGDSETVIESYLQKLTSENDTYTVLLSHRPELFDVYVESGVDLVLSGHAHGGQIRLPFIGGLVAPNQGLFPEYDSGIYTENNTNMLVSRGLGNSIIPLRFNNRPEIKLIELKKAES